MTELIIEESKVYEMVETHFLFEKVSDRVLDLQFVDNFLATIERQFLQTSPTAFDLKTFKLALDKLKSLPSEVPLEQFQQVEKELLKELNLWQNTLGKRSENLETYHLRRYCDSKKQTLDIMGYASLTRFYWSLPHSPSNQSKFDLFVTRLFAKETENQPRDVLLKREELAKHLNELFNDWNNDENNSNSDLDDVQTKILKIDEFIKEAKAFEDFEELVKSNLFERYRAFKNNLGTQMFVPSIMAVAIECNIIVGNVFSELLAKANESLSAKFSDQFDFAGAFHDTSPSSQSHTSKILKEIRSKSLDSEDKELKHIWTLLELVCVESETSEVLLDEETESEEVKKQEDEPQVQERLMPYLLTLSKPQPDSNLLLEYIQKHDELADIDLDTFLVSSDENDYLLLRNVLGVIFWIQEICANELAEKKEISHKLKVELQNLIKKSRGYSEQIEKLAETTDLQANPHLFEVSSRLSKSNLQLKHAIVKLSNRNIESFYVQEKEFQTEVLNLDSLSRPIASVEYAKKRKSFANRWLIAATVLVAIVSGGLFIFEKQLIKSIPDFSIKSKVSIATLPNSEHLQDAYLQKNTLFITARETWTTLSKEKQREGMKKIFKSSPNLQFETVVIMNGEGQLLDDMAEEDIVSEKKTQIAQGEN